MTPRPRDRGFAMIAVLLACAGLAGLAYDVLLQDRTAAVEADALYSRARLESAAASGLAVAAAALAAGGIDRWPIDGRPRTLEMDGARLAVAVEDERGKVAINLLNPLVDEEERAVRRLFAAAGARGAALDAVTDGFLDWRDDNGERRASGAEARDYAGAGLRARDGDLTNVGELARIRGMTPALLARLRPAITIWFGESGGFVAETAPPLAREVQRALEADETRRDTQEVEGLDDYADPSAAAVAARDTNLRGRRLTVRVEATDARGGRVEHATVIELTGNPADPLWVRARD